MTVFVPSQGDLRKREWVEVDVVGKLIPTLWVIYDEYLRKLFTDAPGGDAPLEKNAECQGGGVGDSTQALNSHASWLRLKVGYE